MGGVKINASIRRKYYSLEEILLLEENQPREMIRKKAKNRQRKTNGEAKNMKRILEDITNKKANYTQFSHEIVRVRAFGNG